MRTGQVLPIVAGAFMILAAGCATTQPPKAVAAAELAAPPKTKPVPVVTTGAVVGPAPYKSAGLSVSRELIDQCNMQFESSSNSPKFQTDQSSLDAQDRAILEQLAKCVTTGPLKGRSIKLIGRADPRGSAQHNLALGERRASEVESYLSSLGVATGNMIDTSRGALDATGKDEAGWQQDRRVDVVLP